MSENLEKEIAALKERIAHLEETRFQRVKRTYTRNRRMVWGAIGCLLFIPLALHAFTIPNTFVAGTPAVAADVNANFAAIATELTASKDALPFRNYEVLTSGTTWINPDPANIKKVFVRLVGGGGGGSSGSNGDATAGGGGGAGENVFTLVSVGSTVNYSIGAGGNGGTDGTETVGGDTTFGGLTARGGNVSQGSVNFYRGAFGFGGNGSPGTWNDAGTRSAGGNGGGPGGATGGVRNTASNQGVGTALANSGGGGGGGSGIVNGSRQSGGNGASGRIELWY